ncbi:metallophosphoesterase [Cohnella thailandensis]|uniref:metallophosphoesterase n=1 Tax=Cohnella thailandensis TaxID=557557 RepID=UPI001D283D81|nr:metallophosphoesterase [Cohnella thailandensis]MBP1976955.1 putative MPP superfamily phosphohydrolase [Cohnella thailandensis]
MNDPVFIALLIILVIALLVALYAVAVEPRRLKVTRLEIQSPRIPPGFDGKTILQFSDVHVGHFFSLKRLKRLASAINELKPDIVVFTGDLFDARTLKTESDPAASPILGEIRAPLGKFCVYGNHDFGYSRTKRCSGPLLTNGGFDMLINETRRIALPNGESITISGLDDYVRGRPDAKGTLSKLEEDSFNLLLLHEGDPSDGLAKYPVDLQLSGHSHNGQISLPIVGAIHRTALGKVYVGGIYSIRAALRGDRPYHLYVNRGVGTTTLPIRFGSVPEISLFTLRRGNASRLLNVK